MKNLLQKYSPVFAVLLSIFVLAGCSSSGIERSVSGNGLNLDTVKAGKYDTGKMWTFDYPPLEYFQKEYNFQPNEEWLNNVRMSALRFANYCSASFVSADGLVMTNHHCGRESVEQVTKPGEDLYNNGFYAATLEDERPVKGLYVDQLVLIKDVTNEIHSAMSLGTTPEEKVANEKKAIKGLEDKQGKETGLKIQVVTLFNGGKYSLYGYKRYNDVRLVFSPEASLGFFGGDYDNFTYPRYDLDCNFFRVYDNGKPLKTEHYYHWSQSGAVPGEPVFVVGNPGHTDRLKTVAQLKYARDVQYPRNLEMMTAFVDTYSAIIAKHPEKTADLQNSLFGYSNSEKAYTGMLAGLRDPVLMQKKIDFENKFKEAVKANPKLNDLYGDLWDKVSDVQKQLKEVSNKYFAFSMMPRTSSKYFVIAGDLISLAKQLQLPDSARDEAYKEAKLDSTINKLIPDKFYPELQTAVLKIQIDRFNKYIGADNELIIKVTGGKQGQEAADYMVSNSILSNLDKIKDLIKKGPDAILSSTDPFIYFLINAQPHKDELQAKMDEITSLNDTYSEELGKALFEVYGTSIPPDATFTLRISDGVVKGYSYNGTVAPPYTTFYGLYDRYYSFDKKYPFDLPKQWQNPPADFNLETPMNFVATADIIGGNSGSPVINEKAEIVGLAFDGNIESLPGNFIFTTETNRTVAVHSAGMMEAIKDLYKATRLSDELRTGSAVTGK
ncbi:MAG: S46 family peptidase [Ignavibacteriaceae bacterium]|nr:S46 family peptidase [Ignavibacteriaceae bacterium]